MLDDVRTLTHVLHDPHTNTIRNVGVRCKCKAHPVRKSGFKTPAPIQLTPLQVIHQSQYLLAVSSPPDSRSHGHETTEERKSPWQPRDNKLSVKTGKFLINKTGLWVNKPKSFSVFGKWAIGLLLGRRRENGGVHAACPSVWPLQLSSACVLAASGKCSLLTVRNVRLSFGPLILQDTY